MLGTIQAYAQERLAESGEAETVQHRYALYYANWVEAMLRQIDESGDHEGLPLLEQEHDNVRAALNWTLEQGEQELVLRFMNALWEKGLGLMLARSAMGWMLT